MENILQDMYYAVVKKYKDSEEVQKEYDNIVELLKNMILDKEKFFDLDDKIANYSLIIEREYFILGFKTAFSLLKDVNK